MFAGKCNVSLPPARVMGTVCGVAGGIEQDGFGQDWVRHGQRHIGVDDLPGCGSRFDDLVAVQGCLAVFGGEVRLLCLPAGGPGCRPHLHENLDAIGAAAGRPCETTATVA